MACVCLAKAIPVEKTVAPVAPVVQSDKTVENGVVAASDDLQTDEHRYYGYGRHYGHHHHYPGFYGGYGGYGGYPYGGYGGYGGYPYGGYGGYGGYPYYGGFGGLFF